MKSRAQVQGTNDYNTVSKCSMIKNGYFIDKYVSNFVTKYSRRTPLIHLGYYMRILSVDFTLRSFLQTMPGLSKQIISCGAGFDTSFFRFADTGLLGPEVHFYEVDYEEVTERKKQCILNSESLQSCVGLLQETPDHVKGLMTSQYRLIASDLQNLSSLETNLIATGVMFDVPTLILAEVAICYMDEESSTRLIEWAAAKFKDATFVTYEQVYPHDGFGIVMQNHFESMKCPLLSLDKYPDLQSQEYRYISHGWSSCQAWTAFEMFLGITSCEEQRKVVTLEPFDEFEEWHLEGCHFALMVASKGNLTNWFVEYMTTSHQRATSECEREQIEWNLIPSTIARFAHQSVEKDSNILIFGGFGPSSESLHGRRHEVLNICNCFMNEEEASSSAVDIKEVELGTDVKLDALHQTCTRLSTQGSDGSIRVFVYGGRYSPCKPVNMHPFIVEIIPRVQASTMTIIKSFMGDSEPAARWRHSATCFSDESQDHIVVFGGRTSEMKVLNDMYIWTVEARDLNFTWKEILPKPESQWPIGRFSHSAVLWNRRKIVLCGGLDKKLLPLRDVWCFDVDLESWNEVTVCGMLPRYSHTSVVHDNKMVLLGGVNTLPGRQPGVCVVDLLHSTCIEYALPAQDPENPIMLHNHTSEVINDSEAVIIGGGGNCFSFGTEFNSRIIRIALSQF